MSDPRITAERDALKALAMRLMQPIPSMRGLSDKEKARRLRARDIMRTADARETLRELGYLK